MDLTVGTIVEGKVKSITKFGAFISLPGNRTGMVHISEIAHAYVSDIHEHLTEGQDVKVMVISVDPAGKINLSIKRTQEPPKPQNDRGPRPQQPGRARPAFDRPRPQQSDRPRPDTFRPAAPKEPQSFDDMLKQFMQDSDSKISSLKQYSDHRSKTRRR
jgi:S1 RNA binding domain protein